jgi:hypothetical protein
MELYMLCRSTLMQAACSMVLYRDAWCCIMIQGACVVALKACARHELSDGMSCLEAHMACLRTAPASTICATARARARK